MDFLAAPLLWGLTAAGIPVLIHLLARSKPIPHRFPALRFILRSQKSSARALKLKNLLLLLLRIAALVCLAMGLARPLWNGAAVSAGWSACGVLLAALAGMAFYHREFVTGAIGLLVLYGLYASYPAEPTLAQSQLRGDFVLVVDQSLSMGYLEPDGMRFELARKQALEMLDRLAPDARVALIFATENAERAQSRLSFRHDVVREKIIAAKPTGRGLDLGKAMQAAREILERERSGKTSAIVLFTDLQANAVNALLAKHAESAPKKTAAAEENAVPFVVVDVAGENAPNGAVLSAHLPATVLPADSKVTLAGKIQPIDKNHASLVEVYIDGQKLAQKLAEPKGQESVDVELQFSTGGAGAHAGRLHLTDTDRLMMDQDFLFSYSTGRPASALIVERLGEGEKKSTGFFLNAALQPLGGDDPLGMSGLTCTVERAGELSLSKLSRHRVVILADCGALSDTSWGALQQWTADGGGLFVWLGPNTEPGIAKFGYQQHAMFNGLLPGNIGAFGVLPQPQPITIAQPEHAALAHLTPSVNSVLTGTQIRGVVKIVPEPRDTNAQVVLSLPDGTPLLQEKVYGRGKVLLASVDAGLESSDLARRGEAFVTLALDCVRLLSGEESGTAARLGFPFILTLPSAPADGTVQWRRPDEQTPLTLRVDAGHMDVHGGSAQAGGVSVVVPAIETPGMHTFSWMPAGSTTLLKKMIAVNAEPSESKLRKAAREDVFRALLPLKGSIVKKYSDAPELGADGLALKREVTVALLLLLFAFVLAESFLSNRLYSNDLEPAEEAPAVKAEAVVLENAAPQSVGEKTNAGS